MDKVSAVVRFWSKVKVLKSGCWEWQGALRGREGYGYGDFWDGNKDVAAHRFAYELFKGAIPEGLTIDHLCQKTWCVNPAHLESVTNKENILRGYGLCAINARKTHCPQGHPYDEMNTYIIPTGGRACRICIRKKVSDYYKRVRKWKRRKANLISC